MNLKSALKSEDSILFYFKKMVYGMEIPPQDIKHLNEYGIMDFPFFENISDPLFANATTIITSVYDNMDRANSYQNGSTDYLEWSNDLKLALTNVKTLTESTLNEAAGPIKFNEENVDSSNIMETDKFESDANKLMRTKITRKRKANLSLEVCQKKIQFFERDDDQQTHPGVQRGISVKDPLELAAGENTANGIGTKNGDDKKDLPNNNNNTSRIATWQVHDLSDNLTAELDGSLSDLGADLTNGSYNMSDTLLQLPSLQVFKQEAPSPPNNHENQNGSNSNNTSNGIQLQASPSSNNQNGNSGRIDNNNNQSNSNGSLHHLLNGYNNNIVTNPAVNGNLLQQDANAFGGRSAVGCNSEYVENNGFQYVLAAATSIATKINEDTLTYLNQGQSYEIKLKKLGELSNFKGKTLKSVIGICFHERRMQYGGRERLSQWQSGRPGDRVLEVDVPLSYGLTSLQQPSLNTVAFNWDPTLPVGVYIKVNCISTEFTEKKHGGERGIPLRIQVETYDCTKPGPIPGMGKRLHAGACQIKVFKLKGADRKHKQDREKIMKRPISEQEKYQPSYECTVLNDISYDDIIPSLNDEPNQNQSNGMSPQSGSRNNFMGNGLMSQSYVKGEETSISSPTNLSMTQSCSNSPILQENKPQNNNRSHLVGNLTLQSSADDTINWLTNNRFTAYLNTFQSFSGSDILRLSRDDLIQICGLADGIRLYNALHAKIITPKLTLYVCTERSTMFHAIYLNSYTNIELGEKLSPLVQASAEQIQGYFLQGPNGIHIHINDEVIRHFKNEQMYTVEISPDMNMNTCRVILKPLNP